MKKDFISILDISKNELKGILAEAEKLKRQKKAGVPHASPCRKDACHDL